jgi:cytochrome c peroxidase
MLQMSRVAAALAAFLGSLLGAPAIAQELPDSLKTVPVPPVRDRLTGEDLVPHFVKDEQAAIALGKALFWDVQVGSDGQACASCHFQAGADNRTKNQLSPGLLGGNGVFDPTATGGGGPNYTLVSGDFPKHQLADPDDRDSAVLFDSDDVVSSQGVFPSSFNDIVPGSATDDCDVLFADAIGFHVAGINVRRVEPRNTPTVINAVFNFRNFWDGRANNIFNGVDPWGRRNKDARVLEVSGDGLTKRKLELINSSLASQAVGPPLSGFEMSCAGRIFPKLGKKMLSLHPLALQKVDGADSVLGPMANPGGDGLAPTHTYESLIRAAIADRFWDSDLRVNADLDIVGVGAPGSTDEYTVMEANFALIWGLAIQMYEAELRSDDAPYDRWRNGSDDALTDEQKAGLSVFLNQGKCINCHNGPEFTAAGVSHLLPEQQEEGLVERMLMGQERFRYVVSGSGNIGRGRRAIQFRGEAGSFDLPSLDPSQVGGEFRITLHSRVPSASAAGSAMAGELCVYDVTSFMLNTDGDLTTRDAEFTASRREGTTACGTGVTVNVVDGNPFGGSEGEDSVIIVRDGDLEPLVAGVLDGGNFKLTGAALYDNGFYNIGVRPTQEDLGVGADGEFGHPLSFTRQYLQILLGQDVPDPFQVDPCKFEIPWHPVADLTFFPGGFDSVACDDDGDGVIDRDAVVPTNNAANQEAIQHIRVAVDGAFKTSGLRNVALTGPYFHDGGQETLEQVITFYNRGADFARENEPDTDPDIRPLGLTPEQRTELVAFLHSLTDERVRCETAPFDHPELPLTNGHQGDHVAAVDADLDGQADDETLTLPALGADGLPGKGLPCIGPFQP